MGNISDFSTTTSISKLEFQDDSLEEFFAMDGATLTRSLPQETPIEPGKKNKQ